MEKKKQLVKHTWCSLYNFLASSMEEHFRTGLEQYFWAVSNHGDN